MRSLPLTLFFLGLVSSACAGTSGGTAPGSTELGASAERDGGLAAAPGPTRTKPGSDGERAYRNAVIASAWQKLPNAPNINGKQDDVYFVTPELGWSVNGQGRIFRTEDGGGSWTQLVEKPGTFFRSIMMVSETRGFSGNIGPGYFPGVTDPEPLYETSDRGDTWTPVKTVSGPTPTGICNMQRLDETHLFAVGRVGGPCFMLSSEDNGATWSSRDLSAYLKMLIDVRFTSSSEGMVVGMSAEQRCTILRTHDGGASWQPAFQAQTGHLCWKIAFPSDKVGYVSIQNNASSSFAKTTDGGETWVEKPLIDGPFVGLGAGFITEEIGWMAGRDKAYRTTDGGETWQADPGLGMAINRFRFPDKHTGYAIGTTIYKLEVPK
jgi:photosystem II stability/assembly factor-like uncharacterized protein